MQCPRSNTENGTNSDGNTTALPILYANLEHFFDSYKGLHGILGVIVCCVGICVDICYVHVLTRPRMFSVVNIILTVIALCDTMLMISYIVYLAHFRLISYRCQHQTMTRAWMTYSVFYAHLSITLRSISMWLGAAMGIVRCVVLNMRQKFAPMPRKRTEIASKIIAAVVVHVLLFNIPVYLAYEVQESSITLKTNESNDCPTVTYSVAASALALQNDCMLIEVVFFINGFIHKLIPCTLVAACICILLKCLHQAHYRRRNYYQLQDRLTSPPTVTLVIILVVILVTELPHAILSILSAASRDYSEHVYRNIGDLLDLCSLFNCIITFTLYCSTSRSFRDTLLEKFRLQPALQALTNIALVSAFDPRSMERSKRSETVLRVCAADIAGMDFSNGHVSEVHL